ncbi:MAG: family 20 glycosylhydrolase [Rikenellaceae bacterium]
MRKDFLFVIAILMTLGCTPKVELDTAQNIIPKPISVKENGGAPFEFTSATTYSFSEDVSGELEKIGSMFSDRVERAFGFALTKGLVSGEVLFVIDKQDTTKEGYTLDVTKSKITITANSPRGIFYGTQTLLQLLPPESKSISKVEGMRWLVPSVTIKDAPRFAYRGNMLDVSRHFFTIDELRRHIDQMTEYKFNTLHLHLSDDQGWRIEIKAMPELTEKTSMRPSRTGDFWTLDPPKEGEKFDYGGYYTQEQMKELIAYAKERYVEIIPEIDVPGHSMSLIIAHPELHCSKPTTTYINCGNKETWTDGTLCVGNPKTMEYVKVIFGELAKLFPAKYIHIGGDECIKTNWRSCPKCKGSMQKHGFTKVNELQGAFVKDVNRYVSSLGKTMIGWDDVLEDSLDKDVVVMSWRGVKGGKSAAEKGHKVIMAPNTHCYLDLYQGDPAIEPHTYSRCTLLDSYHWDPAEGVDERFILGGQANLWSENISTQRHKEYMLYPRAWAVAEVLWSPKEELSWEAFVPRVESHFIRAEYADINHSTSLYNTWVRPYTSNKDGKIYIRFYRDLDDVDIYYTLDNTIPDMHSAKYEKPFVLEGNSSKINVQTFRDGKPIGKLFRVTRDEIRIRASQDKRD